MPHGDHEGRCDEDADLTELDFFGLVVITRGTQDDQAHVLVIALDLRPPVNDLRVFDRQLVQPEGLTYPGQLIRVRIEQPQPHKAALATSGRRFLQRHGVLPLPEAVLVVSTINDHLGNSPVEQRQTSAPEHDGIRDCPKDRA